MPEEDIMNRFKLLVATTISAMCVSGIVMASPAAQDHNTTRSNRGAIAAPVDTDHKIDKQPAGQLPDAGQSRKGRNPQTGKEIQVAKKKDRTGRNPQTGKEINIADKKD